MIVPDQIVPAMTRNDRTSPLRRITIRIKKKNFLIYETQGGVVPLMLEGLICVYIYGGIK
jgi:hypothetical protein